MRSPEEVKNMLDGIREGVFREGDDSELMTKGQARQDLILALSWVLKLPVPEAPWTSR